MTTPAELDREAVPTISAEALRERLDRGDPLTLVDVRSNEARAEWWIPGSQHADVSAGLRAGDPGAMARVDVPSGKTVVAVCNAGNSSRIAARQLRERGLDALSLAGGMRAWSLAWNTADVPVTGSAAGVVQVRRTGKGCLSYVVAADGDAVVIDPSVESAVYVDLARARGWRITRVLETHVHADHLSRGRQLAEETAATLSLPRQDRVHFAHSALDDGDEVRVGSSILRALRVPGHTRESTAYLLDGRALFTGDTLFLDGVGRPDLEATAEETRERAHALHRSLRRLGELGSEVLVLPAHTGQPVPFDGKPLAATLAEVRRRVALLAAPEEAFVAALLGRIPPTPPNHHLIVELNEAGVFPDGDPADLEAGANRCAIRA